MQPPNATAVLLSLVEDVMLVGMGLLMQRKAELGQYRCVSIRWGFAGRQFQYPYPPGAATTDAVLSISKKVLNTKIDR